ncbi:MAG TPA: heavy metal-associated domain-containing protein [Methylophilaceae bacterium]|nr:heavy metal-associated domain-containing protein [Methylophilaceae bacterium]
MKKIVFMLIALSFSAPSYAASIKAEVNGMVCAFCAKGIEKKLNALPQSQNVFVDLKNHIVVLELKENENVPLEDFKAIIKDAGYDVSAAEVVDKTAAEIKAEIAK